MMFHSDPDEVTALLARYADGDASVLDSLTRQVYPELRRMARRMISGERIDHTLSATALVHEGFLRLFGRAGCDLKDRRHLFVAAATVMQHVLTDHARRKLAAKRANGFGAAAADLRFCYPADELVAIGELLHRLEATDTRAAQVVRLRFYMGFTEPETAAVLGVTTAIVQQDWKWARAWLRAELRDAPRPASVCP
jgi:RNA polymerase sigma-70 factor, ECF subfamily